MDKPLSNNKRTVKADSFCSILYVNVDNKKLSDKKFREFVRSTLSIVKFPRCCYHFDTKEEYNNATYLQRVLKEDKCKKCNRTGWVF